MAAFMYLMPWISTKRLSWALETSSNSIPHDTCGEAASMLACSNRSVRSLIQTPVLKELGARRLKGQLDEQSKDHLSEDVGETMIRFTAGQKFKEKYKESADPLGVIADRRVVDRAHWTKSLRCPSASSGKCEECTATSEDCWYKSPGGYWYVDSYNPKEWPHMRQTIHFQCEAAQITFKFQAKTVTYGTLKVFFDGQELHHKKKGTLSLPYKAKYHGKEEFLRRYPKGEASMSMTVPVNRSGGHRFTIEYTASGKKKQIGRAIVSNFRIYVRNSFILCADTKACLEELLDAPLLRNTNSEQLKCLNMDWVELQGKTGTIWEACLSWRQCLRNSAKFGDSHEKQIYNLLMAAHVASESIDSPVVAPLHNTDEPQCIDPAIEDPEGWDCDCFDEMHQRCVEIQAADPDATDCLRAQFCAHPAVCASWKESSGCSSEEIASLQRQLQESVSVTDINLVELQRRGASRSSTVDNDAHVADVHKGMYKRRSASEQQDASPSMNVEKTMSAKQCS